MPRSRRVASRRTAKAALVAITLILLLLLALAGGVLFLGASQTTVATVPVPQPNAYDQLVQIGRSVNEYPSGDAAEDADVVHEFVTSNTPLYNKIHAAIQHGAAVPFGTTEADLSTELDRLGALRVPYRLLVLEAKHHAWEDRPSQAADLYADVLGTARKMSVGGLLVHRQVSLAYERLAWDQLIELSPKLTASQRREIAQRLESLPTKEPFDVVRQREVALGKQRIGWFRAMLVRNTTRQAFAQARAKEAEVKHMEQAAREMLIAPPGDSP